MTNPRPTIPRDSINPLGTKTIVFPVKAPKMARVATGVPHRIAAKSVPCDALNSRSRESLPASVVTPPQPTSVRDGGRVAAISKFKLVAPILVILAAGFTAVCVGKSPPRPKRPLAAHESGTVTTQATVAASSPIATSQQPATRLANPPMNGKTWERQAVDAIARGAFAEAAALYERLANERPAEEPAQTTAERAELFRNAARIARRKSQHER